MAARGDNRPPYEKIVSHYRDLIVSGELPPGTLLPSIKTLAEEWHVSTGTVEKATGKLRAEKLVRGIQGVGTEVVGPPVGLSSGAQRQDRGQRTGSSWDAGERSDSHTANRAEAPSDVAKALGINPGDHVIRRTRVYRDGHGVVAHSTSWIPIEFGDLMPELLLGKRLSGGTSLDLIARATGRTAVRRKSTTSARIATDDDLQLLELPRAIGTAAILVLASAFYDQQGRPLEYGVDVGAPGRTRTDDSDIPVPKETR
jgi:DNA-binding GntR family transcriptional regulator